jgi:hypothetical protein
MANALVETLTGIKPATKAGFFVYTLKYGKI